MMLATSLVSICAAERSPCVTVVPSVLPDLESTYIEVLAVYWLGRKKAYTPVTTAQAMGSRMTSLRCLRSRWRSSSRVMKLSLVRELGLGRLGSLGRTGLSNLLGRLGG